MTSYFTFFLIDKFGVSIQYSQIALFAFLAASAVGIIAGGYIGDKIGRKYVIWGSILGAAPFAIAMPYAGLTLTIILAIIVGLVISSAFSAILVSYATELKPGKVGMIAGLFFGLSFGLGGVRGRILRLACRHTGHILRVRDKHSAPFAWHRGRLSPRPEENRQGVNAGALCGVIHP